MPPNSTPCNAIWTPIKQQKKLTKEAKSLLAKAETTYQKRLKRTTTARDTLTDLNATARYLELLEKQSDLKKQIKDADASLDQLAFAKYPKLSEDEIKTLVVDDKWLTALEATTKTNWSASPRPSPAACANWPSATRPRCRN